MSVIMMTLFDFTIITDIVCASSRKVIYSCETCRHQQLLEYLLCLSMLATRRCSHREFRRFICSLTSESSSSLRFPSASRAAPARRTRPTLPWWVVSSTMYPCREKADHKYRLSRSHHQTDSSL